MAIGSKFTAHYINVICHSGVYDVHNSTYKLLENVLRLKYEIKSQSSFLPRPPLCWGLAAVGIIDDPKTDHLDSPFFGVFVCFCKFIDASCIWTMIIQLKLFYHLIDLIYKDSLFLHYSGLEPCASLFSLAWTVCKKQQHNLFPKMSNRFLIIKVTFSYLFCYINCLEKLMRSFCPKSQHRFLLFQMLPHFLE